MLVFLNLALDLVACRGSIKSSHFLEHSRRGHAQNRLVRSSRWSAVASRFQSRLCCQDAFPRVSSQLGGVDALRVSEASQCHFSVYSRLFVFLRSASCRRRRVPTVDAKGERQPKVQIVELGAGPSILIAESKKESDVDALAAELRAAKGFIASLWEELTGLLKEVRDLKAKLLHVDPPSLWRCVKFYNRAGQTPRSVHPGRLWVTKMA
ncbi:hypothetical protein U1Q18_010478 [Sarracenia purpurea var. burkii]